ncbi:tetratricopeptide repeat protein [Xylophilus sp. GOD-11R]|uniref:O-linked N-acetylglucosamine transferase family protein n=1 Tax=Xylophilus sp. GOD-11R TaxID=3089814 RepID=UPI00298C510B|nr:tetratricopeptide repeat protein [Xylophilus sp. GOD-11R]WPB57985.1 tetratricopeptide repeat protein [Xylophilus sp. GOD-11R]
MSPNPSSPLPQFLQVAAFFQREGSPDIAADVYRHACGSTSAAVVAPDPPTILAVAAELHRAGQLATAERMYRHLVQRPSPSGDAYNLLGYALHQMGHPREGMQQVAMAIALDPRVPNYHNHFGLTLQAQGREYWDEACAAYLRALALDPVHPQALDNALTLLAVMPVLSPQADALRGVLDNSAATAKSWLGLATVYERHQRHEPAAHAYARAEALAPDDVELLLRLGALHQNHKCLEAACEVYERLLRLSPGHRLARERLADALCEMGEFDQGIALLETLHGEAPSVELRARIDLAIPCLPQSQAHIDAIRTRLEAGLDRYLASDEPLPALLSPGFFYLAYHGRNDRDLQRKGALLARKSMPQLVYEAPWVAQYAGPGPRMRVGIASSLFFNHSIGRTTRGIVEKLDRARFEVVLVCLPPRRDDDMARAMRSAADRVIDLDGDLHRDRETLAAARLDALFYVDIGMNPYQAMLAHARLAPLQCTHFGHPETNGIPTMDWWISVDTLEPPDAADHYSEQLHLLREVPQFSYYYRPPMPARLKTRADYGFADDEHLFICPQYVFKLHPDFDAIVEKILRADPRARLLLTRSPVAHWSTVVRRRLQARIGALVDRITCLPGMAMPDLMNLESVCDAVLDTLHFNGYNTTLEAWAAHAPVVTLPGAFQRGMHTAGMYRFMDMHDLIARDADDYVRLVLRLAHDADFARAMREKIAARIGVLFENMAVVREYERFFAEKLALLAPARA